MNILFLDAYFEPEVIAYTHLERDILEALSLEGHRIEVICPIPTRGVKKDIIEKYRNKKQEFLYNGRVHVKRFWAPQEGKNAIVRALRYFWCNLRTYQMAKKYQNIDVVFSNSTPPTQGLLGTTVAKKLSEKYKKKVQFIYNLQDIFPDSLVNTKITNSGSLIWKIGRMVENYTYKNSDKIIVISKGFERNIRNKGVPTEKIEVISNWIDLEKVVPLSNEENRLMKELKIPQDKFIVLYAGNFGASQGADIIIKVAENLKDESKIQFVIFGAGPYYQEAVNKAKDLANVYMFELQPQNRISEVYSMGNVALITCQPGIGKAGLPSKVWSIMACNTPIIASFDTDSDLADVIRDSNAGCCIEPGDVDVLKNAILDVFAQWQLGKLSIVESREYAMKTVSKTVCVNRFIKNFCKN